MHSRSTAHFAVLAVTLIYAGGFSITKIILPELILPRGFILLRVVIAAILFWLFFALRRKNHQPIARNDYARLALCGFFGVATNQLFFFEGLARTTPIHAALMMLTTPILVGILANFILKEKFTFLKAIGIMLGLLGAFMLICNGSLSNLGSAAGLGDFYVLSNAASYALYLIIVKPLMANYSTLNVIRWVFLFGAIMVIPFGFTQVTQIDWHVFTFNSYLVLAYVVLAMTFLAYLLNIFAMKQLSPTIIGSYIYLQPFTAALIAMLFFGEEMTWVKLFSGVLIFRGVYLVSKKKGIKHSLKSKLKGYFR